jgi:hypothetical protein
MTDRENSPAFQMLPRSARRVFAAIERAIGDRSSASVSYIDFRLDHGISRKVVSPALKLLLPAWRPRVPSCRQRVE